MPTSYLRAGWGCERICTEVTAALRLAIDLARRRGTGLAMRVAVLPVLRPARSIPKRY